MGLIKKTIIGRTEEFKEHLDIPIKPSGMFEEFFNIFRSIIIKIPKQEHRGVYMLLDDLYLFYQFARLPKSWFCAAGTGYFEIRANFVATRMTSLRTDCASPRSPRD